jgi:hypothetical protein
MMVAVVRCPTCGSLVSEWAAACSACGGDVAGAPLVPGRVATGVRPRGRVRRALAVVGGLAIVAAAVTIWPAGRGREAAGEIPGLVPPFRQEGGTTVLAVTLLDGRRVDLRYPASLGIAQLGLTLGAEMRWPPATTAGDCCWTHVSASRATIAEVYGTSRPLDTYPGRGHPVGLFSASGRRLPPGFAGSQNLVFQFSGWLVEVDTAAVGADGAPPPMSDADRRMWATELGASRGQGGYLLLRPLPPLALAPEGFADRMSATFGLGYPYEAPRDILDIEDGECGPPASGTEQRVRFQTDEGAPGVEWCDPSGLHVTAVGPTAYVDLIASQLTLTVTPGV